MSNHETLLKLLQEKSSMKQDVYLKTQTVFDELRNHLKKECEGLKTALSTLDKRVRIEFKDIEDIQKRFLDRNQLIINPGKNSGVYSLGMVFTIP